MLVWAAVHYDSQKVEGRFYRNRCLFLTKIKAEAVYDLVWIGSSPLFHEVTSSVLGRKEIKAHEQYDNATYGGHLTFCEFHEGD